MDWINGHLAGYLPQIITSADPRPVKEQIADRYAHGGGYRPFTGFTFDPAEGVLKYDGDPPYTMIAAAVINHERVILFDASWVMIMQSDGTYEIVRMD